MVFLWFIVDSPIFQMVSYEPIPQLLHLFVKEQLRRKGLERNALDFPDQAIHLPGAQWAAIQWAFLHHLCHIIDESHCLLPARNYRQLMRVIHDPIL